MTFKDLKKLVELPSYKEQRVPTVKALEVSGVPVVTEKVLENHGSIKVYQNGYVIYRAHKRVTVFSLRDCVHYKYDAAEGAGHHIEEAEFDDYEWHIRLVLEGEDRIFMNYEIIQGKWMPSREDREYPAGGEVMNLHEVPVFQRSGSRPIQFLPCAESTHQGVAIYAALISSVRISSNMHSALIGVAAYTVILCFSLMKTGSLSKQIFGSH